MSIQDYRLRMRGIVDSLNSTGTIVSDDELLLYILGGLNSECDLVVINLTFRHESVTLQEAQYMLQSQELRIEQQNNALNVESHYANVAFKKGGQSRGNGAYHEEIIITNSQIEEIIAIEVEEVVVKEDVVDQFVKYVVSLVTWLRIAISILIATLSSMQPTIHSNEPMLETPQLM